METPIIPKITCKDSKTISNIERDKHLKIVKDVYTYLKNHLNNSILTFLNGRNITDKAIEGQINQIIEDIDQNFISEYEVAAQKCYSVYFKFKRHRSNRKTKNFAFGLTNHWLRVL